MAKKKSKLKELKRKYKPKAKRFINILLGVAFFLVLIGSAFAMSIIFGITFVVAFALSIYNGDLKKKPFKPIAIFIGALLVRIALDQFLEPVFQAQTIADLSVSALIFLSIIVFGWKIKKS